jgi:hypothetical protein
MRITKAGRIGLMAVLTALASTQAAAQMTQVDPDTAIDGDLAQPSATPPPTTTYPADQAPTIDQGAAAADTTATQTALAPAADSSAVAIPEGSQTYHEDDLIGAAEGLFGKGAKGVADVIRDLLKKQGEPNGYIVGREGGGAFVVGLRYGSGTLFHKVEGEKPVYWTGPSIGFDTGASAGNTFVLVYNLYDSEDLYKRFPAGEGQAYFIGGLNVSYMRSGDVVLIPVRAGAGLRLGVNAGYMKFTHKQEWMPF